MKRVDKRLGRARNTKTRESNRLTALNARRWEQSFIRFIESLQGGPEFRNDKAFQQPIG